MTFTLVLVRVGTMLAFLPLLGGRSLPGLVKALAAVAISFALFPFAASAPPVEQWHRPLELLLLVGGEAVFGATMGFSARLVFKGLRNAGELVGHQMGMALARASDPISGVETTVVANFCDAVAVLVFFTVGAHRWFIAGIQRSLVEWPVGALPSAEFIREVTVGAAARGMTVAFQLAAPLLVGMFAIALVMAILARLVPEVNVLIVGFPLRVGAGLVGFTLLLPVVVRYGGEVCRMMARFFHAFPKAG